MTLTKNGWSLTPKSWLGQGSRKARRRFLGGVCPLLFWRSPGGSFPAFWIFSLSSGGIGQPKRSSGFLLWFTAPREFC